LFPNPARTQFVLSTGEPGLSAVECVDMFGRTVARHARIPATASEWTIHAEDLPEGMYFVVWQLRDGRRGSGKILIVK